MPPLLEKLKTLVLGKAKNPLDSSVFQKISLIAFFAWIGLGADGLSSSCYGPEEAFLTLRAHPYLALLVALAMLVTIFVIGTSYSQIIELFPSGGGGYIVASKLLSPASGMVSGCALLIDYALTITISVASGVDAFFSFLPIHYQVYKFTVAAAGILLLTLLNLRGVKDSVMAMVPVFVVFVVAHVGGIVYGIASHAGNMGALAGRAAADVQSSFVSLGFFGMLLLLIRAYSMGAGTFTGIEAISNGISALREPKVETARRTMFYMMLSLAFIVSGVMLSYVIFGVRPQAGKTLNAVLFGHVFGQGGTGHFLLFVTLISEAAILFVAAQTGFLDGPRVIAAMALDRWFPARFALLNDRLVIKNGIMLMGGAALAVLVASGGSVQFLIVLYSINVFITFILSQLGMVRHWWTTRGANAPWLKKLTVNVVGLVFTVSILASMLVIKFHDGGWITLCITGTLIGLVILIKKHYLHTSRILGRLNALVQGVIPPAVPADPAPACDPSAHTAVLLVNGYNGLGLHTLTNICRMFSGVYRNFIFVQVGVIDAGAFKSQEDIERLKQKIKCEVGRYASLMRSNGYYAEGMDLVGLDVVSEVAGVAPKILGRFPKAVFFGGQLVFPSGLFFYKWLHNYTVFAIQKKFYLQGIPVMVMPVQLNETVH